MGITDNFIQLHRLKRDLGIVVDNNPVMEYLNQTIIKKEIKAYFQNNFTHSKTNEIMVDKIAATFKVNYLKAEDFTNGFFEIKKASNIMLLYKEHGIEALIWKLMNNKEFKTRYPNAI